MKKDFKSIAFLAVFTMIAGCAFYCIGFYDSAIFTLLTGLTMLAIYHAGLYNRGVIEDNTIASQKEIIEMFLRFRSALPLALARTFSLWFGASCSLLSGLFFLRCHQKADGNDRQSEGVVRITSNTLCLKGKEDFTQFVLNTEVIRKQRCTFASIKRMATTDIAA